MSKVRVIIEDGIVMAVQRNAVAEAINVEVEIIDFNRNGGNRDALDAYYMDPNMKETRNYSIDHCESDDEYDEDDEDAE